MQPSTTTIDSAADGQSDLHPDGPAGPQLRSLLLNSRFREAEWEIRASGARGKSAEICAEHLDRERAHQCLLERALEAVPDHSLPLAYLREADTGAGAWLRFSWRERQLQTALDQSRLTPDRTLLSWESSARSWAEGEVAPKELAAFRLRTARQFRRTRRPTRPGRVIVANRARRTLRTAAPTRGDPDDGDPEPADEPWALSFVDRAPVLWRIRGLRCRLLELREGVSR